MLPAPKPLQRYFENLDDCEKSGYRVVTGLVPVRLPDGRLTMAEPVHQSATLTERPYTMGVIALLVGLTFVVALSVGYKLGHVQGSAQVAR
jgi:hypothetical protein